MLPSRAVIGRTRLHLIGGATFCTVLAHGATGLALWKLSGVGNVWPSVALYYLACAVLMAAYMVVVLSVRRGASRREMQLLVAAPAVLHLGWLISLPWLSIDAYSYLVDAAHFSAGLSPYQHAVREAANTPVGRELAEYGWRPTHGISPYGPVWMNLMRLIGPLTTDIEVAVRVVKAIALAATAVTAWLIYRTASIGWRVPAFTAFWWNPAVIIEGAGEGHNDALMVGGVVFVLWALRRRMPVVAAGGLAVAVLTKWLPLLFAPACLAYVWRRGWLTPRTAAAGAAVLLGLTAVAFSSVWVGADTFNGLRRLGAPRFVASTVGTLGSLADGTSLYAVVPGLASAAAAAMAFYPAWISRSHALLVWGCAATSVVYILIASPLFWAWYVLLPIGLLVLTRDLSLVFVLTAASRIVAPFDILRLRGGLGWSDMAWLTTVLGLWLPLAFLVWRLWRTRRAQTSGTYAPVRQIV